MSRNSEKKKKSTSKYRNFKISPLIPVIAIIEVIVLVVISTYAWYVVSQEKNAYTGIIGVDADSGLDIDFKNATYDDQINLWDYVPDDFEFSPVTSLDGRNVYVPTSGTFGNDSTNEIKFREATINDINTKFLDVDFTLTNTTNDPVNVYLNNESHFRVYDNNHETSGETMNTSRALRLAFYTNDAKHGNVSSSILENTNDENARLDRLDNRVTVYFNKPARWENCFAYIWKVVNGTTYVSVEWPGSMMTRVAGTYYSFSFSNTDNYTKIIFSNGERTNPITYSSSTSSTCTQTCDLTISNGNVYEVSAAEGSTGTAYATKTIYFIKPTDWDGVRAHAFKASGQTTSFTSYPGDVCTNCGADIYSYTFPAIFEGNAMNGIVFNNTANQNNKTADLPNYATPSSTVLTDGELYYFTPGGSDGRCTKTTYSTRTVYFNNTNGWTKPYAKLYSTTAQHEVRVPMTNLSGGIYYATVPSIYNQVGFEDREGYNNSNPVTTQYKYTQYTSVTDGQIYRPDSWTSSGYGMTDFSYTGYVGTSTDNTYAVISPGVSAGFQRSYTPVVGAATTTGIPTQVVPAFACSLDNYIKGSNHPMFTIPAGGMLDLSMVVWLEGTDKDCTAASYAAKNIDLYLSYSTNIEGQQTDADRITNYTYRFYDKTREVWTGDRLTNDAGVSVAPVMQLYDATEKRGYLMHAISTSDHNGVRKIDAWECSAPASLYTDPNNHDLYFRRVDPYNEDEVWNYWHPSVRAKNSGAALKTISGSNYVNFTAFADGAPASSSGDSGGIPCNTSPLQAATDASTPANSCGGLWGTYETTLLTVVDNTWNSSKNIHWLNDDGGVVTIKYIFKYANNQTQAIEYKGSGPYRGQLYYFVVPTVLKTDSSKRPTSYTFHRFWGFNNNYAMNIYDRNKNMSYNSTGNVTINSWMQTYYVWLGQSNGATNIDQYWFGDLLYVDLSTGAYNNNGNEDVMNNAKYKLHMWNGSGATWTVCLYQNNGDFTVPNFTGLTYIAVTPYINSTSTSSGGRPTGMQLQRWPSNFSGSAWNYSYDITFNASNHNLMAYKWEANNTGKILTTYNNDQVGFGWSQIPSYTD